jgi:hypothetical protein
LWEDQVSEDIKSARLQVVQKMAEQHGMERPMRYLVRTMEVLVEGWNPRNQNQVQGRTRKGRQVFFDGHLEKLTGRRTGPAWEIHWQRSRGKVLEICRWSLTTYQFGKMCSPRNNGRRKVYMETVILQTQSRDLKDKKGSTPVSIMTPSFVMIRLGATMLVF